MKPKQKLPTTGGTNLGQNPFAALGKVGLPPAIPAPGGGQLRQDPGGQAEPGRPEPATPAASKNRGRVDILRETGNRGGKTVTVVTGFTGIGQAEKELLAKKIRVAVGCGGTVKDGRIEIQGDQREMVARILAAAGFQPVFAGG